MITTTSESEVPAPSTVIPPVASSSTAPSFISMGNAWETLAGLLKTKTPMAFSKFNDGEVRAMFDAEAVVSRGDQKSSQSLSAALKEAFLYCAPGYYAGIPCPKCWPTERTNLNKLFSEGIRASSLRELFRETHSVPANTLINSNYRKSKELFATLFKSSPDFKPSRNIVVVISDKANPDGFKSLGIIPNQIIKVSGIDAWKDYPKLKDGWKDIPADSTVLFCCGPLGRVLTYEWFKNLPKSTCLELGSFFDPYTRGLYFPYHCQSEPYCSICNPCYSDPEEEILPPEKLLGTTLEFKKKYYAGFLTERPMEATVGTTGTTATVGSPGTTKKSPNAIEAEKKYAIYRLARLASEEALVSPTEKSKEIERKLYEASMKLGRVEAFYWMSMTKTSHQDRCIYLKQAMKHISIPSDFANILYPEKEIYQWKVYFDLIIHCYYIEDYDTGIQAYLSLLDANRSNPVPKDILEQCHNNVWFNIWGRREKSEIERKLILPEAPQATKEATESPTEAVVPNIFHFIFFNGGYQFSLTHFLALLTAFKTNAPDKIYIYTNAEPAGNKWWDAAKKYIPVLSVEIITVPQYVNGHYISSWQHKADLVRLKVLFYRGGIYADLDILFLKSIQELRKYPLVLGKQQSDKDWLCNAVILAAPQHPFIRTWLDKYLTCYGNPEIDWWAGLSVHFMGSLSKRFPGTVTELPPEAFYPYLWWTDDIYQERTEVISESPYPKSYAVHNWETEQAKRGVLPKDLSFLDKNNWFRYIVGGWFTDEMKSELGSTGKEPGK